MFRRRKKTGVSSRNLPRHTENTAIDIFHTSVSSYNDCLAACKTLSNCVYYCGTLLDQFKSFNPVLIAVQFIRLVQCALSPAGYKPVIKKKLNLASLFQPGTNQM